MLARTASHTIGLPGTGGALLGARVLGLILLTLAAAGCATVPVTGPVIGTQTTLAGDYLSARHAGKVQDTASAAQYYGRALEKRPMDRAILERAFLLDLSSGRVESAVALAERIVDSRSDDRLGRLVLAAHAMREGAFGTARAQVDAAGSGPLTDLVNLLIEAWALSGNGQADLAVARLRQLGDAGSLNLYQAYHAALIHDLAGNTLQAEDYYIAAMKIADGASLRVVQAYGRFLERAGQRDTASSVYRTFLTEIGAHPAVGSALYRVERGQPAPARLVPTAQAGAAEAIFAFAGALAREDERGLDLPIVYLNIALYLHPNFPVAQSLLAEILDTAGRHDMAAKVYSRVPRSSPLWANAQIQIALGLSRRERTEEAIDTLKGVIKIAPENIDVLGSIGDLFLADENYGAAAEYYGRAIQQIDGVPQRQHWALFHQYGIALERSKRWDEAETALKRALALQPNQPFVLNYLGYSWIDRGVNLDEAMAMIRTAVKLQPRNGFIIDSLGWGLYQRGDFEDAVEQLERAVSLEPGDPVINDHLGDAYWQVERRIEARYQWNHTLRLDPEPDLRDQVTRKLELGLLDGAAL
ncbi:MAG: tetratricopeptide repeat protein [Alphaproteobacteria bacterium]